LLNELLLIKLLSELLAKHCNLPSRFWWFFSGNNFDIYLEMGISYKERSNRGGTPTGDQEIPAEAEKKVISNVRKINGHLRGLAFNPAIA
jgi:hypothetical protein